MPLSAPIMGQELRYHMAHFTAWPVTCSLAGETLAESHFEGDSEGVECRFPSVHPALLAGAFGVE